MDENQHAPAKTVLVAINPKAGSGKRATYPVELVDRLKAAGFHAELCPSLDGLGERASELSVAGELRALVAAGGDGTIAELANRTEPHVPLAILPLGTENLLAKHLGQSDSPSELVETIIAGKTVTIDAGRVEGRIFLLMLSAGFDAEIVREMHETRRGTIRHLSWIKPIWNTIRSYDYPPLHLFTSDSPGPWIEAPHAARWALVMNLPCYARGLNFVAEARGDDGQFDICAFEQGSLRMAATYFANVFLSAHREMRDCRVWKANRIRIESDQPIAYQIDGDYGGKLPVEIEMLRSRVRLLVPPERVPHEH